jgi:hypothetical protein
MEDVGVDVFDRLEQDFRFQEGTAVSNLHLQPHLNLCCGENFCWWYTPRAYRGILYDTLLGV